MKTYLKTIVRMFKKHFARFLSICAILFVSIGFISGIGSSSDILNNSLSDYYKDQNVSDFILKSTAQNGFSNEEIENIKELFTNGKVDSGTSIDVITSNKRSIRYYFLDFDNWNVNLFNLKEGDKVSSSNEAYCESKDNVINGCNINDIISIDFKDIIVKTSEQNNLEVPSQLLTMLNNLEPVNVTVKGVIQSPLTFALDGEPSYNNSKSEEVPSTTFATKDLNCLENIIYLSKDIIPTYKDVIPYLQGMDQPFINTSDLYISIENRDLFNAFSNDYKDYINSYKEKIKAVISDVEIITLFDNYSFNSLKTYSDRVANIGYIMMAVFLFVTILVVFTTMTRLLDEERLQIACLKTLGYSSTKIVIKYLLFAFISMEIGALGAYFVGLEISRLIYYIFNYSYAMPPLTSDFPFIFYLIAYLVIVLGTLLVTLISGYKVCNEKPAYLLKTKAPKSGKKVLLEKITFIWNKLSFKYKSTCRNILRYKNRFIMIVVSVALSMGLVMIGLGILDLCLMHDFDSIAMMGISIVVIVFAALLCGVGIYTLTNINISERNHEIATLMVLGYNDSEVLGYIYREVYLNSIVGIIIGYPVSIILVDLVFHTIDVGAVNEVSWFMWLIAPLLVIIFTFIVTFILRKKILKIDMNESLKAGE